MYVEKGPSTAKELKAKCMSEVCKGRYTVMYSESDVKNGHILCPVCYRAIKVEPIKTEEK